MADVPSSGVVIFDLDGTLACIDHRRHLLDRTNAGWRAFYAACPDDTVNVPVAMMWDALAEKGGYEMWIVSGRSDEVKAETEAWLRKYGIRPHRLLMRQARDHQPDVKLKRSWLDDGTIPPSVICVFDDRASVVAMWRENGIPCFQVAPGDF